MGIAGGGGWWAISSGQMTRGVDASPLGGDFDNRVRWAFAFREVMVSGRQQTSRKTLIDTLSIARGAPILAFDIAAAKLRVDCPAVGADRDRRAHAAGYHLGVSIDEREPLALWQLG